MDHDAQLMQRTSRGDKEAYRELFDRHYGRAVNVAYRSLGDRELAEDVAMDAFARIYESRQSYKPQAKFSTYLYRVVVNLSLNAAKRRGRAYTTSLDDIQIPASSDSDPARHAQRAELSRTVKAAVLSLAPNQRMALVLTRYEQMSYSEAAEAMGVSVGAVESLLHRAKEHLRKALSNVVDQQ